MWQPTVVQLRRLGNFFRVSRRVYHGKRDPNSNTGDAMSDRSDATGGPWVSLESLHLDTLALRSLPVDPITKVYARSVSGACFSKVKPVPVDAPRMVAYSALAASELLGLPKSEMERVESADYFSGNRLFDGADPAAHCYCGHQFGYFSGQLGDGAAMYLGEVINRDGVRWEVQLKGAGLTPYSRDADGRKVLRSSIREFLCSEAMHHLGIATTRAVTCVTSDSKVVRDIFYNGNPILERCTVVCRVAKTFIRFGSFEIFKTLDRLTNRAGPSVGRKDILVQMLQYTISNFFKEIYDSHKNNDEEMYLQFFTDVVKRTAKLVANWQCVGFCHGVLNTDNMSVMGDTIDYGPFGFLDFYDPDHICNGSDDGGRYSYSNQPSVCSWNLQKLAEALEPVLPLSRSQCVLNETYVAEYEDHYFSIMRKKLGLLRKQLPEDRNLVELFLKTMETTGADFTNCFRGLSTLSLPGCQNFEATLAETKLHLAKQCSTLEELRLIYKPRMEESHFRAFVNLIQQHPEILDQLGKKAEALEQELLRRKTYGEIQKTTEEEKKLSDAMSWNQWLEMYKCRLATEIEGQCDPEDINQHRVKIMNGVNPKFILRNYLLQVAIEAAEKDDFSEINKLLQVLTNPYDETLPAIDNITGNISARAGSSDDDAPHGVTSYDAPPPKWARCLKVTCSS